MIRRNLGTCCSVAVGLLFLAVVVVPDVNEAADCFEPRLEIEAEAERGLEPVHSRVRRSFGGREPINFTLVNQVSILSKITLE
jgi:hypothetical protein